MRACVLISVLFFSCATAGYVEPKLPKLDEHCRLSEIDPQRAREINPNQGVRKADYVKIADASKACRDHLLEIVKYNYAAAAGNRPDDWKENLEDYGIGSVIMVILEALVYIAAL